MNKIIPLFLALILLGQFACKDDDAVDPTDTLPPGTKFIEASAQRSGDATAGEDYLRYGDFVSSGWPLEVHSIFFGTDESNHLNRTGDNATVNHQYTAIDAPNGVRISVANCYTCHSGFINGSFIPGIGNNEGDFTDDQSSTATTLELAIANNYGANSPEVAAYQPLRRAIEATGSKIATDVVGVNPADKLTAVLIANRDKDDLHWLDEPTQEIPDGVIPTDVPAWWLLKKKNAMFYSGNGRGDFARIMMASSLLTLQDTTKAREVDNKFSDVLAFINSIEPPVYPETLNETTLGAGEKIFTDNCSKCHGTYGSNETYPNLIVDLEEIGTDPFLLNVNFAYNNFIDWYNESWFSKAPYDAYFVVENGYIAPPLDGVWATAPYLHNGSVPNLETLLNSNIRPKYWKRIGTDYNLDQIGLNFEELSAPGDKTVYDTTVDGYGNGGHLYGDGLSEQERSDLIEYMKSL